MLAKLSPKELPALLRPHVDVAKLKPSEARRTLLEEVRAFDAAVRAGNFYDGFNVNSRNFMEKSEGTERFIRDCLRLLERAIAETAKSTTVETSTETRESFGYIFALLRRIDEGDDDVFFADEQGSFQVGVRWEKVFPAWFACLARSAEPMDFARLVVEWVDAFEDDQRGKHFTAARRVANAEQRQALRLRLAATPPRRR